MRGAHHYFADFLLLVLLLIILVFFLVASPMGLRSLARVVNIAGIGLEIQGVKGTLLEGISIDSLSWKEEKSHIELKKIQLDFKQPRFLNSALNINKLSVAALNIYVTKGKKGTTNKVVIPDIPIPLNLLADHVQLDKLRVIRDRKELLFKINDMAVEQVAILNHKLSASSAIASPVIAASPMNISLNHVSVDFDQPHAIRANGKVQYSHIQVGKFEGEVKVGGSLTNYQLAGDINWNIPILGNSHLKIEGQGDYDKATISSLDLQHSDGNLLASGEISWVNKFIWDSVIYGKDIRTRHFVPEWPAQVDFNLHTSGSYDYDSEKWLTYLHLISMGGELNGFPVEASGLVTLKDSILSADKFLIKTNKNKLLLAGKITEPFNLKWDVDAKDIGQLMPGFKGSVVGKGVATGTTFAPSGYGTLQIKGLLAEGIRIDKADIDLQAGSQGHLLAGKGKITIRNVQFQDFKVASVDFDFDGKEQKSLLLGKGNIVVKQLNSKDLVFSSAKVDFDGSQKFIDLKGEVKDIKISGLDVKTARVDAQGALQNHQVHLKAESKQGNLQLNARGGWFGSEWKGLLNKIRLSHTETGDWLLQKPVNIQIAKDSFKGSEICIINPSRGSLCTDTTWDENLGHFASKGKMVNVPLAQLEPWLPESLHFKGEASATYDVTMRQRGVFGTASIVLPDSFALIETEDGDKEKLAYRDGKVIITFRDKLVDVDVSVLLDKRGKFTSRSTITLDLPAGRHKINGEANFEVSSLSWAQQFLPDISHLTGDISSKISFKGLLASPKYSGEVRLANGHIHVPDTGTELSNINLSLKTTRPNEATIEGMLNVKASQLKINGAMQIKKLNDWRAELKLRGSDLLFMNTYEAQVYASPDLALEISPRLAKVTGKFHIPKARIRLSELPETAIYESDDVVFVGNKKKDEEKPLRILPNVVITLGEDIRFNGFGLASKLTGKFHLGHNKNTLVSRGTLKIKEGEYRAYGQRLTIEHGVLVFHGPLANPGLDIRATRSVDDIKVGINLAGTLQKPKSTIFSDPPLSESDALSYLVTGQSLANTTGDQSQLLVQAVRTLGISSGSSILNRIGGSVGLDDVNIITYADYKKNKLQLGKRLGPKLYIRYITGLFDTFNKIAVDYKISNKWSLQAESGEEQGLDFIYNIDR